jgi:hypothetical protein
MVLRLQLMLLQQVRLQVRYSTTRPLMRNSSRLWQFLAQWQVD